MLPSSKRSRTAFLTSRCWSIRDSPSNCGAVTIARRWSPPPSSTIFDLGAGQGELDQLLQLGEVGGHRGERLQEAVAQARPPFRRYNERSVKLRLSTDLRAVVLIDRRGDVIASVLADLPPLRRRPSIAGRSEGPAGGWGGQRRLLTQRPRARLRHIRERHVRGASTRRSHLGQGPVLDWHVGEIVFDPRTPTTMHGLSSVRDRHESIDGGATTWTYSIEGLPGNYLELVFQALALDPSAPETLYLGTTTGGLYKSVDNGATWTSVGGGVPDREVASILVDPSGGGTVLTSASVGSVAPTGAPTTERARSRPGCRR